MSDGNTAIPVSPTEDEAMKLSNYFRMAAEAIVNASTMPAQIEALSAALAETQRKLDAAQLHAGELDQTIHELRSQRDQAYEDVRNANAEVDRLRRLANDFNDEASRTRDALKAAQDEAFAMRQQRDQSEDEALKAWDARDAAEAKLAEVKDRMKAVFGLQEPEPAPKPEPVQPEPAPEAATERPWEDNRGPF